MLSVLVLALASLAAPIASPARTRVRLPHATTGPAQHVLGNTALLTGAVNPNGRETSWYFQYGLTTAYTSQTPTQTIGPSSTTNQRVGQALSGLQSGSVYHYRLVASNAVGTSLGKDRTFGARGHKLKFVVPKAQTVVYGATAIFSGNLTGFGSPNHRIALQASPFPFLESFTNIGVPGASDALGRFAFRLAHLTASTELRVITLDPLPLFSPITRLNVAVKVDFHVRSSGHNGLVRMYGTVTPAVKGASVFFQVEQAVRPGINSEATTRFVSRYITAVKHGGRTFSRFSMVAKIKKTGRYRAYVKVRPGPLVAGISARTFYLRAPSRKK
jgi:hypothetical protein